MRKLNNFNLNITNFHIYSNKINIMSQIEEFSLTIINVSVCIMLLYN